jgi:4-amino-4-deoxy-L-arabinose transferase-like glycosyltransferase
VEVAVSEVSKPAGASNSANDPHTLLQRPVFRRLFVAAWLIAAALFRIWIAVRDIGDVDADEAIVGLMARHILEGEFPAFYWGQNYGGTAEVFLTAGVFKITGSSVAAMRAVPLVLFAIAVYLTWRIGIRIAGERGRLFAAVVLVAWPPYLVIKSMLAHGYYGVLLVTSTAFLLLTLQAGEKPTHLRFAALGLVAGLGWWTSPQIALVALPATIWLLFQVGIKRWLEFGTMAVGFLGGAAPWWIWNAANGWASLHTPGVPASTYLGRLSGLFTHVLPTGLGVRLPRTQEYVLPHPGGWILFAVLLAAFVFFLVQAVRTRDRGALLLSLITIAFPPIYALSPYTWLIHEPRYLFVLFPVICLILGWAFDRSFAVALVGLMMTLPLTFVALRDTQISPGTKGLAPVISVLRDHDVEYGIADYWIAYPITFETREEIIFTSSAMVRYHPHDALVRSQPNLSWVFVTGSADHARFVSENHTELQEIPAGEYSVFVPSS